MPPLRWAVAALALVVLTAPRSRAAAQCSDGSVEARFGSLIVGCEGAWNRAGLVAADGSSVEPQCDRRSGNDGELRDVDEMEEEATVCSASDLCADGWHLCVAADLPADATCRVGVYEDEPALFVTATRGCIVGGRSQVVGCGQLGCDDVTYPGPICNAAERSSQPEAEDPCDTFNYVECVPSNGVDAGWTCADPNGGAPIDHLTKKGRDGGGVLCCAEDVAGCACLSAEGNCLPVGAMEGPCLLCEGGDMPGAALVDICVGDEDAGMTTDDGGASATDGGSGTDGGQPNPDPDAPTISFRGEGGCECSQAGERGAAPMLAVAALALFITRRRR